MLQNDVKSRLLPVAVAMILGALPVGAQTRGLVPADFYKEVTVEEVEMRPQGDMVAFTVMTIVEKENRRHREIWLQPITNGTAQGEAFRFTAPTEESSQPHWSPDGALLAFTSKRDKDDNSAWFARVGGHGGEAFHVDGVGAEPVWSPDGKWIAYVKAPIRDKDGDGTADKKDEREGWVAPDAISRTLDAKRFDGRVVTSMRYKSNGTLPWMPHYATRDIAQIFVVLCCRRHAGAGDAAGVRAVAGHLAARQSDADLHGRSTSRTTSSTPISRRTCSPSSARVESRGG